jgi:hypothetical protein
LIGIAEKACLRDFSYYYVLVKEENQTIALFYFQSLIVRNEYYPDFSNLSFAAKNLYCLISSHNYNLLVNGHIFSTDMPGAAIKENWSNLADLMHVYVLLETTDVMPALLQAPPALTAAFAGMIGEKKVREINDKNIKSLLVMNF